MGKGVVQILKAEDEVLVFSTTRSCPSWGEASKSSTQGFSPTTRKRMGAPLLRTGILLPGFDDAQTGEGNLVERVCTREKRGLPILRRIPSQSRGPFGLFQGKSIARAFLLICEDSLTYFSGLRLTGREFDLGKDSCRACKQLSLPYGCRTALSQPRRGDSYT
jgi:hypothetical protein